MTRGLAPIWDLLINGSETLPAGYKALISHVTVAASIDGADELTISASARDPLGRVGSAWRFVGEQILAPGNTVVVRAGYADGGDLVALQRFRLHAEDTDYPRGQNTTVEIRGYSAEARLGEYTRPRVWKGPISDSDIARELARLHGLTVTSDSVQASPARKDGRTKAKGTSDLVFLNQLAVACGYGPATIRFDPSLNADVLYFRETKLDRSKTLDLVWNPSEAGVDRPTGNLLTFRPSLDLHGVPTRVEVSGWDPVFQTAIVVAMEVGAQGQEPTILTGAAAAAAGYKIKSGSQMQARALEDGQDPAKDRTEAIPVPHLRNIQDAIDYAKRWVRLRNAAFLVARGSTLGIPSLWVAQVHNVLGVAPVHRGLWATTAVRHAFSDQGYGCDVDFERVLEEAAEPQEA